MNNPSDQTMIDTIKRLKSLGAPEDALRTVPMGVLNGFLRGKILFVVVRGEPCKCGQRPVWLLFGEATKEPLEKLWS